MTSREHRLSESLGRERKAARLALTLVSHEHGVVAARTAAVDANVRSILQQLCGYGHVSDETWARVTELLEEVPA